MISVQHSSRAGVRRVAFTLVEVLIAASLMLLVVGGVLSVVVMAYKSIHKTQLLDAALQNTRTVQEHLTREISAALSKGPAGIKRLDGTDPFAFSFDVSDGASPAHFAKFTYMIPIGDPMKVPEDTDKSSLSLLVVCPPDVTLKSGDYVMLGLPDTKDYLRILSVDPTPGTVPGTEHNVTLNFAISIQDAALLAGTPVAECSNVKGNVTYVPIYRERCYEVADPGTGKVTQLLWWENTSNPASKRILSDSVSADQWHMFAQVFVPAAPTIPVDGAVRWRFKYSEEGSKLLGGREEFWEVNQTEGRIRARSGDPVNLNGPNDRDKYSTSTSTTTTSIPTTTVSTTSSSTTSSTTTTSIATTKATTTSTTSIATTKSTTTKSTTTSTKSTSTTSKSTTSTKSTSTTSKSTTSTKSTSTTSKSTTSTTSVATTKSTTTSTKSTSTTTKSTTAATTTTSTTTKATTVPTTTIRNDG